MSFNTLLENADGYALAFRARDITTPEMRIAIPEWFSLYYQRKPDKDEDPCQQIPYTIVRRLSKTVLSEYEATGTGTPPPEKTGSLADALRERFAK